MGYYILNMCQLISESVKIHVMEDAGKSGGKIPSSWAVADTILGGFIGFNVGAIAGALIGVDVAYGGFGIGSAIGTGLLVGTITIAEYFDVMPDNFHIFGITSGEFSAGLDFKKRQDKYAIDLTQYYKSLEEIKQQKITYEDSDDSFEREKAEIINESLYLQDNTDKQKIESEKIEKEIKIIKDKYNNKLKVIELTDIGDEVESENFSLNNENRFQSVLRQDKGSLRRNPVFKWVGDAIMTFTMGDKNLLTGEYYVLKGERNEVAFNVVQDVEIIIIGSLTVKVALTGKSPSYFKALVRFGNHQIPGIRGEGNIPLLSGKLVKFITGKDHLPLKPKYWLTKWWKKIK